MTTTKTDAARFQNALRIMYSLDEVTDVLPPHQVEKFFNNPIREAIHMDADRWARVYALIEARQ